MKKLALIILVASAFNTKAQIYVGEKCSISFFSATKLENIDAVNTITKPMLLFCCQTLWPVSVFLSFLMNR